MIEITLLKVTHSGEQEAKKLIPYIQRCDVFGIEHAACTEEISTAREKSWQNLLATDISRSRLQNISVIPVVDEKRMAYIMAVNDYLFRNKRLMWCTERFTPEEAKRVKSISEKSDTLASQASMALGRLDLESFFPLYHSHLSEINNEIEVRDKEMARNFAEAEDRLRLFYPSLKEKQSLRYTQFVGAMHEPEKYYPHVLVQPLDKNTFENKVFSAVRQGTTATELKKELLALALELGVHIPSEQSMGLGYEDLTILAQKAVKDWQQIKLRQMQRALKLKH